MFHRSAFHIAACALALMDASEAAANCRSFENKPSSFASMSLLLHKRLKERGDGVAIKYGGEGQILSVIKFDDDLDEITDDLLQKKLTEVAGGIRYATELRGDQVVSAKALPQWNIGKRVFVAETVTATYKYYNVTAYEYVGLSRDAECFFMVRFTNAADGDDASSLDRYKDYVEQAHMLLLKREDVIEEPVEPQEPEDAATSEVQSD